MASVSDGSGEVAKSVKGYHRYTPTKISFQKRSPMPYFEFLGEMLPFVTKGDVGGGMSAPTQN